MSAIPAAYNRQANFTSFEASNPTAPKPGASLDAEFNAVKTSMDATQSRLSEIQRDDGALRNGIVTLTTLDGSVTLLMTTPINPRGAWATATSYAVNDVVTQGGTLYLAIVGHISGTFATDLSVNKWQAISGDINAGAIVNAHIASVSGAHAASAIAFTPGGTIASTDVQGAIAELGTEKAPIANPSFTGTPTIGALPIATIVDSSTAANVALASHTNDTTDAHDASAISVVPVGNIAATDVQAALQELDNEKATRQAGMPLRSAATYYASSASGTTITPADNTIPQVTEGTEFMLLGFTPSAAGVTLEIDVLMHLAFSVSNTVVTLALHPNGQTNAHACATGIMDVSNTIQQYNLKAVWTSPDGAPVNMRVRAGAPIAGTLTFNGVSGASHFGGVLRSSIRITELSN